MHLTEGHWLLVGTARRAVDLDRAAARDLVVGEAVSRPLATAGAERVPLSDLAADAAW